MLDSEPGRNPGAAATRGTRRSSGNPKRRYKIIVRHSQDHGRVVGQLMRLTREFGDEPWRRGVIQDDNI